MASRPNCRVHSTCFADWYMWYTFIRPRLAMTDVSTYAVIIFLCDESRQSVKPIGAQKTPDCASSRIARERIMLCYRTLLYIINTLSCTPSPGGRIYFMFYAAGGSKTVLLCMLGHQYLNAKRARLPSAEFHNVSICRCTVARLCHGSSTDFIWPIFWKSFHNSSIGKPPNNGHLF